MRWALLLLGGCVPVDFTTQDWDRLAQFRWSESQSALNLAEGEFANPWVGDLDAERLGRRLYFDPNTSIDGSLSCDTCHQASSSGADPRPGGFSLGVQGLSARSSPTLLNSHVRPRYGWFGEETVLWRQIRRPLGGGFHATNSEALSVLLCGPDHVDDYTALAGAEACGQFRPDNAGMDHTAMLMAAYVRTLVSGDSDFDRFMAGSFEERRDDCLSHAAIQGARLFAGKAACDECHRGPTFSDDRTYILGVGGQVEFDGNGLPRGYLTPTLRQIGQTAPYMHDGSEPLLWDVLEFYRAGGDDRFAAFRPPELAPLNLSSEEMLSIESFLASLDGAPLPYCWVNLDGECCDRDGEPLGEAPAACAERSTPVARTCR